MAVGSPRQLELGWTFLGFSTKLEEKLAESGGHVVLIGLVLMRRGRGLQGFE